MELIFVETKAVFMMFNKKLFFAFRLINVDKREKKAPEKLYEKLPDEETEKRMLTAIENIEIRNNQLTNIVTALVDEMKALKSNLKQDSGIIS